MYLIWLRDADIRWTCKPGETLAQGADRLQAGRRLFPGCRGGGCGVCKVRVLAGRCRTNPQSRDALPDTEREDNLVLACCAIPDSDMEIERAEK